MTVTDADLPYLIPIAAISVWWVAMYLASRIGGWSLLAEAYATEEDFDGAKAQFQSVSLTRFGVPANYNNLITIGADASTLRLSVFLLFRPFHPPLKIPFADLSAKRKKLLVFETVELTAAKAPPVRISITANRAVSIAAASGGTFRVPS